MEKQPESEIDRRIAEKIAEIAAVADHLPGVVVIHNIKKGLSVEYMSPRGLRLLGITLEELKCIGPQFYERFFNQEATDDFIPKLINGLLERNDDEEIISFFEQVKFKDSEEWVWHLSTLKILMRDEEGSPLLTITIAIKVEPDTHITPKVNRLLDESKFLRENVQAFAQLGKREQEILKMVVLGKSSTEIAEELFISEKTVNTHRRNLKVKLRVHSHYELSQFARAFDLI
ncbi:LuxR family transcriptional regulator [Nibribacter ruber]|uniref:LuxR family transcriptional regulator n=1 Tax=Nibribacter ruber TaxID=2698458 RepID=A0A6P1P2D0_9BACT|nr:LuxR C-terminal-related transcriptional regulator [Nibribacter ruber]QHL88541.1 LuxR family transcriptional regulator [Nibribacter ruber]